MGIWIELGVFVLAILWALWQFQDLKKERLKREARQRAVLAQERAAQAEAEGGNATSNKQPAP